MATNKLNGILLDCGYRIGENGNSVIQLYVSDERSIRLIEDNSFSPYFYVVSKDPQKTLHALEGHVFGEGARALRAELSPKENAPNAIKVYFKNPQELVRAREAIEGVEGVYERREYDIPFTERYLIDKCMHPMAGVEIEEKDGNVVKINPREIKRDLRLVALDLETYSPGRFSDARLDPILMCVLSAQGGSKVYTYKKTMAKEAIVLSDEKEMLERVFSDLRSMSPDVLVTYNGDSFDMPYIKERCERLKVKCDFGFGPVKVVHRGMYNSAEISGTQHLDAYALIKFMARIGAVSLVKFDIENVSEKLFGKYKEKLLHTDINGLWDKGDIDRIVKYNREDGEVTLQLAKEFLPLQIQLASMLRQTLFETSRASSSQMVEQLLIIRSFDRDNLIPNRPGEAEVTQRSLQTYEGGFVRSPLPGLHENIAVLDFRSLHPTIMISHNISPETMRCSHDECKSGENVSPDGDWFCMKRKGFLSGILEEILKDRIELKRKVKLMEKGTQEYKMLNARQHALKILLNSHYGYLGYPRSRWYSRESARAVTAWSRHYIQQAMEKAEKDGYTVLYGDTDSMLLLIPNGKNEEDVRIFMEKVNDELPDAMELEFDGMYRRGIFVTKREGGAAKKKYALIDFRGNLKIVGFEYVRRDWAIVAKETQRQVIEAVLKEGDPAKAVALTKGMIKRLKEGKVPKAELVIMTMLKRRIDKYESIGPHVAAAKKAIARGKDIDVGSVLGFVVTKKNGKSISEKAELEEYVAEGNYDADYYIEHQILPAVLNIMQELGYDKQDLISGGKQSSLSSFM
ncbi:MAG TPA: hypothetical protein HA254_07210 [Candidatus Diapherotrites archaeon]|uniref:DNA-directed DNA polymerase n=1 Tax=Candidatus Iainarchaeum sp. TaxID=3101447 RepID=A0A7J4IZU7_9ARCH|nr:hypothetical protein [Candidatus Diapherotrites archaeon]